MTTCVLPWRPGVVPVSSSEQRRRRFLGLAGSQTPQSPPMRGTPPDEPQPRMVAMMRAASAMRKPGLAEEPRKILGGLPRDLLEAHAPELGELLGRVPDV